MSQEEYSRVSTAFSGTDKQLGPIISGAMLALGMVYKQPDHLGKQLFVCTEFGGVIKRTFYEHQVSGAADTLVKTFGSVMPQEEVEKLEQSKPERAAAIERLRKDAMCIGGHINADQTGMGKTIQTLLACRLPSNTGRRPMRQIPRSIAQPSSMFQSRSSNSGLRRLNALPISRLSSYTAPKTQEWSSLGEISR